MINNLVFSLLGIGSIGLILILVSMYIKSSKGKKTIDFFSLLNTFVFSIIILLGIFVGVDDMNKTHIAENLINKLFMNKYDMLANKSNTTTDINKVESTVDKSTKEVKEQKSNTKDLLSQVGVKIKLQHISNNKRKVVVEVTNNSKKIFNGSIRVETTDSSGKYSGSDIVYTDNLAPGTSTYAIIWVQPSASKSSYIVNGDFTDMPNVKSNLKYTIVKNDGGLRMVTLYIITEDLTKENLTAISKELKQKYPKEIVDNLLAYYYPVKNEAEAKTGKLPEFPPLSQFEVNYKGTLSELSIPYIDNTVKELKVETVKIE